MRKETFSNDEYYHIYNRGVDKREIFVDEEDLIRFLDSLELFNTHDNIGSIFKDKDVSTVSHQDERLVDIVAFNLVGNHYHFILRQLVDNGITIFMHKVGTGYTNYFNEKNKRSGCLFQGSFKAIHIYSNQYLLNLSVYVNLNDRIHLLGSNKENSKKMYLGSWGQYTDDIINNRICYTSIVSEQFSSKSEYKHYAETLLPVFVANKQRKAELDQFLFDEN